MRIKKIDQTFFWHRVKLEESDIFMEFLCRVIDAAYQVILYFVSFSGQDYITDGPQAPLEDVLQNWKLTYSSENNGVTKLRCYRKLNTGDDRQDVVIEVKEKIVKECVLIPSSSLAMKNLRL